jgi:hypothetical protein
MILFVMFPNSKRTFKSLTEQKKKASLRFYGQSTFKNGLKWSFLRSLTMKTTVLCRLVEFSTQIKTVEGHFTYGSTVSKHQTAAKLVPEGHRATKWSKMSKNEHFGPVFG